MLGSPSRASRSSRSPPSTCTPTGSARCRNAASAGLTADAVAETLDTYAKYPVPPSLLVDVREQMERYGRLRIVRDADAGELALTASPPDVALLEEVARDHHVATLLRERLDERRWALRLGDRGTLKQALLRLGWPADDEAGYSDGASLGDLELTCELRTYQRDAVATWWAGGSPAGGNGVLVLPCSAGKTVIGLAALAQAGAHTLVLATSILAARQWISELLDKTDIDPDLVGEYSGERKQVRPVTVATYQVITWRDPSVPEDADLASVHPHLGLFDQQQWGLVVYDEVHLLPTPSSASRPGSGRSAGWDSPRRWCARTVAKGMCSASSGPSATTRLEAQGWIAPAVCTEIRVDLPESERMPYATAEPRSRPSSRSGRLTQPSGRVDPASPRDGGTTRASAPAPGHEPTAGR